MPRRPDSSPRIVNPAIRNVLYICLISIAVMYALQRIVNLEIISKIQTFPEEGSLLFFVIILISMKLFGIHRNGGLIGGMTEGRAVVIVALSTAIGFLFLEVERKDSVREIIFNDISALFLVFERAEVPNSIDRFILIGIQSLQQLRERDNQQMHDNKELVAQIDRSRYRMERVTDFVSGEDYFKVWESLVPDAADLPNSAIADVTKFYTLLRSSRDVVRSLQRSRAFIVGEEEKAYTILACAALNALSVFYEALSAGELALQELDRRQIDTGVQSTINGVTVSRRELRRRTVESVAERLNERHMALIAAGMRCDIV